MGSPEFEQHRHADETPHQVTMSAGFWLAELPCTQALWKEVMHEDPGRPRGDGLPVNRVSRDDCHRFLAELAKRVPSLFCRLPWEAEWEYACRAQSDTPYPWRGELTEAEAWFEKDDMRAAGLGIPNSWGLRDMVGNIGQWCADSYAAYPAQAVVDPHPTSDGSQGVGRGGCWEDTVGDCRSARRMHPWVSTPVVSMGLRILVEGRQRLKRRRGAAQGRTPTTAARLMPSTENFQSALTDMMSLASGPVGPASCWPMKRVWDVRYICRRSIPTCQWRATV